VAGYELAIEMLGDFEEIDGTDLGDLSLRCGEPDPMDPEVFGVYRRGPQRNLVLAYLDRLQAADSREMREGFAAILTDWIATVLQGAPDAEYYKTLIDRSPAPHREVPTTAQLAAFGREIA
jgi:hypothetical protein